MAPEVIGANNPAMCVALIAVSPIQLALAIGLLIGVGLVVLGVRGSIVHRRPTCRRCRFDLSGVQGGVQGGGKCPECGADLAGPRAVLPAFRRRRWVVVALGLFVLSGAGGGLTFLLATAGNVKVNTYKPAWLLSMEARGRDTAAASSALDELLVRAQSGKLGAGLMAQLVDEGLRQQADESGVWLAQWGDLIAEARSRKLMDDTRWVSFLRHGLKFELDLQPRVRQGAETSLRYKLSGQRLGDNAVTVQMRIAEYAIGPQRKTAGAEQADSGVIMGISRRGSAASAQQVLVTAPIGKHEVHATVEVTLFEGEFKGADVGPNGEFHYNQPVMERFNVTLNGKVEVVAPDEALVKPIKPTPESTAAIVKAIRAEQLHFEGTPEAGECSYSIRMTNSPHSLAFDVVWRWRSKDGTEHEATVGSVMFRGSLAMDSSYGGGGPIKGFDSDTVDIVLRPSAQKAESTPDLEDYWNGEIVLPNQNVEIRRPGQPDDHPGAGGGPSSGGDRGK